LKESETLDLALIESTNAVWKKAHLLKELNKVDMNVIVDVIKNYMPRLLKIYDSRNQLDRALEISLKEGITIYDSLYIALAENLGVGLLTGDRGQYEKGRKYVDSVLID
jgi:predicted nucleic acid-binding protein